MKGDSASHTRESPPTVAHLSLTPEDIDVAEFLIGKWDLQHHEKFTPLFGDREEAKRFLEVVTDLHHSMRVYLNLKPHSSSADDLIRAHKLMPIAIKRLEKEFHVILSVNRKNLDSDSLSRRSNRGSVKSSVSEYYEDDGSEEEYGATPPRTPPRPGSSGSGSESAMDVAMADLRSIAECMISCGYARECVKIYKIVRKSIVDEAMHYLGVEKLNHSQMQKMEWDVLEAKIRHWLHAVKIAVKTLFQGEKILCEAVFASSEKIAESCFAEICKDAAVNLFTFADNFGKSKKILSPEKMFRALDLYDAISELWPDIETIFSHESLLPVKTEADAALVKLAEAVRIMLTQLETAIQKDNSKTLPGGGVHPLTRYVMNFLIFLGDYTGSVSDIISDCPVNPHSPLPERHFSSPTAGGGEDPSAAAITVRVGWLILLLLCKLDGKATTYNDAAVSYLFLANNLNYVVSKVRSSNLGLVLGADWIWQHRSKVNRYLANYERIGWTKVISSLPTDPTAEISIEQVKAHFRQFNHNFEEAYKKQTSLVIPDPETRDRVKISLSKLLIPGYRAFYQKHRGKKTLESWEDPIIRYAPEDLDNYLSDLFFPTSSSGSVAGTTSGKSSSSVASRRR